MNESDDQPVGSESGGGGGARKDGGKGADGTTTTQKDTSSTIDTEKKLLGQRKTAKMLFTRKVNFFNTRVTNGDHIEALQYIFSQVNERFDNLEQACEEIIEFYVLHSYKQDVIEGAEEYLLECAQTKCNAHCTLLNIDKAKNRSNDNAVNQTIKLKLEPIKFPKFDGNVRDFPSFLDDFTSMVVPTYGKNAAVLKQCLSDIVLEKMKNRDKDYEEMIKILREEYGDPRRVVDSVIEEFKGLSIVENNDDDAFLRLISTVHGCYIDLAKIDLQSEISNVGNVSTIEKLLPEEAKRRWVRLSKDVTNKNEYFPRLLEFLLEEKKDIEYRSAGVRKFNTSDFKVNVNTINSPINSELVLEVKRLHEEHKSTKMFLDQVCNKIDHLINNPMSGTTNTSRSYVKEFAEEYCYAHDFNGHDTSACGKFRSMSADERMSIIRGNGCCFTCLHRGHLSNACPRDRSCGVRIGNSHCQKRHHPLLHDFFVKNMGSVGTSNFSSRANILLETSMAYSSKIPVKILWDSGAMGSLITHRKAQEIGAKGVAVSGYLGGVGNFVKWVKSKEYVVPLHDVWGNTHEIKCVGMDEVAGPIADFDVNCLSGIFPEFDITALHRPSGYCDMLIGNDYCELQPRVICTVGKFQLMESAFGYSIRGIPPSTVNERSTNRAVVSFNNMSFHVNKSDFSDYLEKDTLKESLDNFFAIENAGVYNNSTPILSREEEEYNLIERGLRYDEKEKVWVATYPWIKNPENLPNNYNAVLGRLKSTEKKLLSDKNHAQAYQKEMIDMQERGVARKLEKREMEEYEGPVHYIAHFAVVRPDSVTTPVRIVFDPSAQFMGHRLNDYWAKGPNVVNNIFYILLRFRKDIIGMVGDISKMYHSVKLEKLEQHVHRFLYRDPGTNLPPDHYALCSVSFGDKPSSVLATIAMKYTAGMFKNEFPEVYDVIDNDTYVDDILPTADSIENAKILSQKIDEVLAEGNFHVKGWVMTGDNQCDGYVEMNKEIGQKVLGMKWIPATDVFKFEVNINFSPKYKGMRMGPGINQEECQNHFPSLLTRRLVLSQVAAIFDAYGFVLPYTLKAKELMRSLIINGSEIEGNKMIDWDEPLSEEKVLQWKDFFIGLFQIEKLSFPRSIKPKGAVGNPILILFSDASQLAYGCCAYIQWKTNDGLYFSRLIAAKNRMAPKRQISIPRLELMGAVLSVRLRMNIVQRIGIEFAETLHLVDSSIVRAQIQKESQSFKTFVAVRIGEIHEKSDPLEWWWVDTQNNVADMVTKARDPAELDIGSVWQDGPSFLKQHKSSWPISQNFDNAVSEIMPDLQINATIFEDGKESKPIMNIQNFNSFKKLVKITARIFNAFRFKSFKGVGESLTSEIIIEAEKYWLKEAQKEQKHWQNDFKTLGPYMKDGIIYVGGRIKSWLKENWNREGYILVPANHPLSKLIITELHYENHEGVETTLCKLLSKYWIPRARKEIKTVKNSCVRCRIIEKKVAGQCMGQIAEARLKPTPCFYNTSTDLFGPYAIRDNVKRRSIGKCYGVIFTCLTTRAVHLDLVENYSTDAFLNAVKRFSSIRGFPYSIHSDNGTQMIAASKELMAISDSIDDNQVKEFAANNRINWSFNRSSDAPWLNGACESLIKSVKINLQRAIHDSILSYAELQTVLFESANIINSRPIGIKPGNEIDLGSYLSPNDLLLGRSDRHAPVGPLDTNASIKKRLKFIQNIVSNFWTRWQRDVFPTLLLQKKWHTKKRNVKVGDVVIVQDSNVVRGQWKLGEVAALENSRDGCVRDVMIRYKISDNGAKYKDSKNKFMKRSVHKLVVILPVEEK